MKIESLQHLDLDARYTYADYLQWHFEERVELIDGRLFPIAAELGTLHQQCVGEIFRRISNHIHRSFCKAFVAPFDVRLTPIHKAESDKIYTVVQPDVCVVCDPSKIDTKGCIGAPDLIVEVLSPGNTDREMNEKFEIYQNSGVNEYWLVEPNDRIVLVYQLDETGKYIGLKPFIESQTLTSRSLGSFELLVRDIFDVDNMKSIKEQLEFRDKLLAGLEKAYEKLIDYKKQKNSVLVVMRDGKITHVKPE